MSDGAVQPVLEVHVAVIMWSVQLVEKVLSARCMQIEEMDFLFYETKRDLKYHISGERGSRSLK